MRLLCTASILGLRFRVFFPFSGDVNLSLRAKEVILKGKRF